MLLYPRIRLGHQQSTQGARPTKKVVLSASEFAVPDLKLSAVNFIELEDLLYMVFLSVRPYIHAI